MIERIGTSGVDGLSFVRVFFLLCTTLFSKKKNSFIICYTGFLSLVVFPKFNVDVRSPFNKILKFFFLKTVIHLQVSFSGQLRASFSPSLKIIAIEVTVQQHQQYLSVPYLMVSDYTFFCQ